MKPASTTLPPLLALAAHPDDLEFAVGAIIAKETGRGAGGGTPEPPPRPAHFIIVTRGESASHGTPAQRAREARTSAKILGATLQFLPLAKDAALKPRTEHALKLAAAIRKIKPSILLAPTLVKNQHPDHAALGTLAQTAARLARYAGIKDKSLRHLPPHSIDLLLFYAITPDAEPKDTQPILIDVSDPQLIDQWTRAMQAHASQLKTRNYIELQLTRARLHGLRAGVQYAIPLFPNDPLLFNDLGALQNSARSF